jgi:uncharacterized membrane protein
MPNPASLPLHAVVIHFPIAGAFFAGAALALGLFRPSARPSSLNAAALLLAATMAGGLAALVTGWLWADQLAYLAGGWGPIPGPKAVEGLARLHAILAFTFVSTASVALGLVLRARKRDRPPVAALLAAFLACCLVAAVSHLGGTMVHAPPAPKIDAADFRAR